MLEITNQPYYERVRAFAEKKGLLEQFEEQVAYLRKYADPEEKGLWKVVMSTDFAPASFSLAWFQRQTDGSYEFMMNGALVYHADQQGWHQEEGKHVDPLAIVVGEEKPWMIHT